MWTRDWLAAAITARVPRCRSPVTPAVEPAATPSAPAQRPRLHLVAATTDMRAPWMREAEPRPEPGMPPAECQPGASGFVLIWRLGRPVKKFNPMASGIGESD